MSTRWVIVKVDVDDDVAQGDEYDLVVEHIEDAFTRAPGVEGGRWGLDGVTVTVQGVAEIARLPVGTIEHPEPKPRRNWLVDALRHH